MHELSRVSGPNNPQTIRKIVYGDLMFGGTCTFNGLAVTKIPHYTI